MVHEGSGNADFSWNEFGDGGGGELFSCGDGDSVEIMKFNDSWYVEEVMEPPNNKTTTTCKQTPQPPPSNEQEKLADMLRQLGPLGLKLTISPYFMNSLNTMLLSQQSQETNSHSRHRIHHHPPPPPHQHHRRDSHHPRRDDFQPQPPSAATEKMKAANFPALSLKIGAWERVTVNEGDLVAKCYYAKKKLVWEFLERALKRKVEIQWNDISAIKATIKENAPGILQIELRQPPTFYDEVDPQPRKHTNWRAAQDFTGGQALICRRHCLKFPAGVLDKHYEKLLQCDSRLFQLSQQPFPSSKYHYFPQQNQAMYSFADYSINFKPEMVSSYNITAQQQLQAAYNQQMINQSHFSTASPNSVIELARMPDHNGSTWTESVASDQVQGGISNMASTDTTSFVYQNIDNYVDADMYLSETENNMLTDCSNQQYCQDSTTPMDALMYMYHGGNPACNIATNQHLSYEHNTASAMHTANHSTELGYPPQDISWVAQPQPFSVAALPQNMAQTVSQAVSVATLLQNMAQPMTSQAGSMAAMHQNMAQAMSQPVTVVALPQNMPVPMALPPKNEVRVNLLESNSLDQMMDIDIYH